jgi:hypothetical protein
MIAVAPGRYFVGRSVPYASASLARRFCRASPYRDQQFQHHCSLRTRFQQQGLPIISVDSKKREMIGNFKNAGAKWDRSPVLVNDHDFRSDASGAGMS